MNKKILFNFALYLLLLLFNTTLFIPANGQDVIVRQTIIIQSDGSIYPDGVPIQRNGDNYTLTQDIYDPILIEKSNITFDGASHSLIGPLNETQLEVEQVIGNGPGNETQVPYIIGIDIGDGVSGVKIENLKVHNFSIGAYIRSLGNNFTNNYIYDNIVGVLLSGSANSITYNYISDNRQGLFFGFEDVDGIGNIPENILISHNSFVNNNQQLSGCVCKEYNLTEERHSWDDGKEGNYWSDYNGTDVNNDGIGDSPYIVDILNQDSFPLMLSPVSAPTDSPPEQEFPLYQLIAIIGVIIIILVMLVIVFKRKKKAR